MNEPHHAEQIPQSDAGGGDLAQSATPLNAGASKWRSRLLAGALIMIAWYVFYFYWLTQGGPRLRGVGASLGGGLALAAGWSERTDSLGRFLGLGVLFALALWALGRGVEALAVGLGWG